ncbi:Lon protease [Bifidobacterium sp. MA2]|uniref:endopeptidase La n=1 Tax=Bifidobacterium santillanense TaxID=2809028 RepID=A0ABS5UPD1_9BIFI|nr:S16 family serine protease [Bifidobacterium santillanense]MBT1172800.1 Lon protease [Bifidobacterium santillanense]
MSFLSHLADALRAVPSVPTRVGRYLSARSPRYLAGLLAVVLGVLVLCLPSAYSVEWPGPTRDVLGTVESDGKAVIQVSGAKTHKDSGRLLLVTVSANGVPGYPVTNAEVVFGWLAPDRVVMPREAVVPVGQTTKQYKEKTSREMSGSQSHAVTAAKRFLKARGVDVSGLKVSMHVDDIGGPSAGMMYTLGLIDKLTPEDETGGATIAGTGTIDAKGKVGAIGGIRLKMIGAKRDGATWFLAPKSNCDEVVGHVPSGLRDVSVSTLDEAYAALVAIGRGKGETLPHCTVK